MIVLAQVKELPKTIVISDDSEGNMNVQAIKQLFRYFIVIYTLRELRTLVVEMVLATDMSCHFQQIKAMKCLLQQPDM